MGEKLAVYATRARVDDVDLVTDAFHLAMQPRLQQLPDVFHPDMLHPARTALVLMENAQCRSSVVLAAAQLTESLLPELRLPAQDIATLGTEVRRLAEAVPDPLGLEAGELLETLVTAEADVALIAVAERLDHARHLHMRSPSSWRGYYEQTVGIYLPLAQRVHEDLFARLERWARSFQRKLA
jgi:(p)ppGpp synthase/HD superfamily hydrolase